MEQVLGFAQVRADGKIIPSTMKVKDMLALGWQPSKVVALAWSHAGRNVRVDLQHGGHGIPVPDGNFVAAICNEDEGNHYSRLMVFSADGTLHGEFENHVRFGGENFVGRFAWFDPPMNSQVNTFGAVFQTMEGDSFRCDLDAKKVLITSTARTR